MSDFTLQTHIDTLLEQRPSTFPKTAVDFATWQTATRSRLANLLGIADRQPVDVSATSLQTIDRGSYVEEKVSLDVGEGVRAPIYLLIPKTEPPYTPIVAFHGHDPSVQFILGQYPDAETAVYNHKIDNNYAQALAQAGYLVCAVEQRGMGERLTNQQGDGVGTNNVARSCRHLAFSYMMQGRTLLGERVWDGMCAIRYLQSRADVRPSVLGCTGHSGGGTTALFLSILDERVSAAVVSSYFCSFAASILGMPHCECNYVPGILELGEMGDIAALLAPRPLCCINGRFDPIFPIEGTIAQFETVRAAYEVNGRSAACKLHVHNGEHAYHLPTAQSWFKQWLEK